MRLEVLGGLDDMSGDVGDDMSGDVGGTTADRTPIGPCIEDVAAVLDGALSASVSLRIPAPLVALTP